MVLLKFADGSTYNIPLKDLENIPFFNIFPEITNETEINLGQYNKNFTYKNLMKCIGFSEKLDDSCIDLMDYLGQDIELYDKESVKKTYTESFTKLVKNKDYLPIIILCQFNEDWFNDDLEGILKVLPLNVIKKCITKDNVNVYDFRSHNTSLLIASKAGNLELVKHVIKVGADVNYTNSYSNTALIFASKNNYTEIVKYLIQNGTDINHENFRGDTALMCAYNNENIEIIKLLLNAGANVDDTLFELICRDGNAELVKIIINKGKCINSNKKLLSVVSINGHLEVIKLLVNAGIDINSYNALTIASYKGHRDIVEFLVKNGADVNIRDKDSYTPLMYACKKGYINIVEFLIKSGANVNVKTTDNYTPLILAIDHRKNNVVELLLQAGADINAENDGMTALALASITNQYEIVELLKDY